MSVTGATYRRRRPPLFIRSLLSAALFGIGGPAPTLDTWYQAFLNRAMPVGGSWVKNTAGYRAAEAPAQCPDPVLPNR